MAYDTHRHELFCSVLSLLESFQIDCWQQILAFAWRDDSDSSWQIWCSKISPPLPTPFLAMQWHKSGKGCGLSRCKTRTGWSWGRRLNNVKIDRCWFYCSDETIGGARSEEPFKIKMCCLMLDALGTTVVVLALPSMGSNNDALRDNITARRYFTMIFVLGRGEGGVREGRLNLSWRQKEGGMST